MNVMSKKALKLGPIFKHNTMCNFANMSGMMAISVILYLDNITHLSANVTHRSFKGKWNGECVKCVHGDNRKSKFYGKFKKKHNNILYKIDQQAQCTYSNFLYMLCGQFWTFAIT